MQTMHKCGCSDSSSPLMAYRPGVPVQLHVDRQTYIAVTNGIEHLTRQVLENERQPIPDVPAVYFVRATEENVLRVADDAGRGLYDSMHLNFTPALPRALMERLAAATFASNSAQRIAKVRLTRGEHHVAPQEPVLAGTRHRRSMHDTRHP